MSNRYNVYFNNTSALDLGIIATKRPNIPVPEKNITDKELKGKDGTITRDYETYKNIQIDVEFNFIEAKDFNERCRMIKKWLNNIKDKKLQFSDDMDYFYKVKKTICKDIVREIKRKGTFTVGFVCHPFQYDINGQDKIILTNNFKLENPYFILAKPKIEIKGEGTINLNFNGKITIVNVGQSCILDGELGQSYRYVGGNLEYQNTKITGKLPILIEGENNISWTLNTGARLDSITMVSNFKTI